MKFYAQKVRSSAGRKKLVRGPHLARGPQFADPCFKRIPIKMSSRMFTQIFIGTQNNFVNYFG